MGHGQTTGTSSQGRSLWAGREVLASRGSGRRVGGPCETPGTPGGHACGMTGGLFLPRPGPPPPPPREVPPPPAPPGTVGSSPGQELGLEKGFPQGLSLRTPHLGRSHSLGGGRRGGPAQGGREGSSRQGPDGQIPGKGRGSPLPGSPCPCRGSQPPLKTHYACPQGHEPVEGLKPSRCLTQPDPCAGTGGRQHSPQETAWPRARTMSMGTLFRPHLRRGSCCTGPGGGTTAQLVPATAAHGHTSDRLCFLPWPETPSWAYITPCRPVF